jgi:ParB-like chromosome segregation protein Spo0J
MDDIASRVAAYNATSKAIAAELGFPHPIASIQWVPINKVAPNDYNPNAVAPHEMRLLHTSISQDGYTQPVVTIYDAEKDRYVIVDGFHRYTTMRNNPDIAATTNGYLPVVVIDKPIADRMASTVRHNRARGKHSVAGMGNLVFQLLREGVSDADICNRIGLEPEELLRLKHITGFSKLLSDHRYGQAWEHRNQIMAKKTWNEANPDDPAVI